MTNAKPRWFADGLNFTCTKCGKCCGGAPGYVWFQPGETAKIAEFLKMSRAEFLKKYTRKVMDGALSLLEKENLDCIFFETGKGCQIYEVRPEQCRTFPFWKENIKDRLAWRKVEKDCPGIGGLKHFSEEEIVSISKRLSKTKE